MTNILVTGGAGFIGSHLCEQLAKNKNNVVVSLDNYFTGSEDNHVEGVDYIEGHTANINNMLDFNPSLIYHLGEYSRVEQSFDDIDLVHEYNIVGTFEVLQFAVANGAKIVYAGSSTKFVDEDNYIQSPYAWSKARNTELVRKFHKWYGLLYGITYFYNVYGPREISNGDYSTVVAKYIDYYSNNRPLPVVKPGIQKRNFTHVYDIVDGLIRVGEYGYGDNFGIGNPREYSVLELAKMFDTQIDFLPERRGNRMSCPINTSKTEQLGWKPQYQLEDYINEHISRKRA